uniref:Ionotropic glutamate receptor C-terminal domain-containing protein n=1 Tax=Anopheles farauti TaxID=69004 RepID=A0A182Q2A1_9DIPT
MGGFFQQRVSLGAQRCRIRWGSMMAQEVIVVPLQLGGTGFQRPVPKPLEHFFHEALESNINTLYLRDVSRVMFFDYLTTLPIAKVLLDAQKPLGMPLERSLVVLGIWGPLVMGTLSRAVHTATSEFKTLPAGAKYLVLMEDQDLRVADRSIAIALGTEFATRGIIDWCVTGHRTASFMSYAAIFSNQPYGVHAALNFSKAYGFNRIKHLDKVHLSGIATESFPYSYYYKSNELEGKDINVFDHMIWPMKTTYVIFSMVDDDNPRQLTDHIVQLLIYRRVDFLVTRKQMDHGMLPLLYPSANVYFCLVAPRIAAIDLTGSLTRPFDWELWLLIGSMIAFLLAGQMLCQLNQSVQRKINHLLRSEPTGSLISVSFASFTFLLLECYLAKVTSFFLVYRFRADCDTLEEFFAQNIPIRLPDEHLALLSWINPDVAQSIRDRAVNASSCEEFSDQCAHLDTIDRATFMINNRVEIDTLVGHKPSYIVRETLGLSHQVYVYARGFPLIVQFHHALRRVYETGFVVRYDRLHQQRMFHGMNKLIAEDKSLRYEHLVSLWLFYGFGLLFATFMFMVELMTNALTKRILSSCLATTDDADEKHRQEFFIKM